MSVPFRYQVFFPMVGLILVTLVATSLVTATIQSRRTKAEIDSELRRLEQTLRQTSFPLTEAILRQLHGLTGADFVLSDSNGHTIASTGFSRFVPSGGFEMLESGDAPSVVTIGGNSFFHRSVALVRPAAAQPRQMLHILYPESIWIKARLDAIVPPCLTGGTGIVFAGILSLFLARRVTRPIASLSEQMERLARNDYRALSLPNRRDEIRDLMVAANSLATQLRDLSSAIRRSERYAVMGRLGGGLAHQLRNGVTGARLALQLHSRGCDRDRESIAVAERQLELVEKQLISFLAIGRTSAAENRPCNLGHLIREVSDLVTPACRHRGIRLEKRVACLEPVVADVDQIRQLLVNLTLNAIEASERGDVVTLALDRSAESIRLAVYDTGRGVSAELSESLFDPFVTSKPEGIGLGLAVAKQIAEAHGGLLHYHSDEDQTCFEFLLPVEEAAKTKTSLEGNLVTTT